eukprot:Polyplicarium_translucidae@DN595_c0_g1_i1.p1
MAEFREEKCGAWKSDLRLDIWDWATEDVRATRAVRLVRDTLAGLCRLRCIAVPFAVPFAATEITNCERSSSKKRSWLSADSSRSASVSRCASRQARSRRPLSACLRGSPSPSVRKEVAFRFNRERKWFRGGELF